MNGVFAWGIPVIHGIQSAASPALTAIVKAITWFGSEYFYLALIPVLLWCVDERVGLRIGLVQIASAFANSWLKLLFATPRPYELDPSVGLARENSFGFPSGHSQSSATFWAMASRWLERPWGLIVAFAWPIVIAFTRVYLGVHFPADVVGGLALGWLIGFGYVAVGHRLEALIERRDPWVKVAIAVAAALVMVALDPKDTSLAGAFCGVLVCAPAMLRRVRFDAARGSFGQKSLRWLVGIAPTAALYFGLALLAPGAGDAWYGPARFVRYGLVGAWVTLGAPWVFVRFGLAATRR